MLPNPIRAIDMRLVAAIAAASGEVHKNEVAALTQLLGADFTEKVPKVEEARKELEAHLEKAKDVPLATRAQLIQHLTIVAAADGVVDPAEVGEMHRIATRLGVDAQVVEQTLAGAASPMD